MLAAWFSRWRDAIVVLLLALALLGFGYTLHELRRLQGRLRHETHIAATSAREACLRSKVFGAPFIDHIERVEAKLHTGALERSVEWPIGSHVSVSVLDFYRTTIPKSCPTVRRSR